MAPPSKDEDIEKMIGKVRQQVETCSEACNINLSKIEEDLRRAQDVLRQVEASMNGIVNDSQLVIPQLFEEVAEMMGRSPSTPRDNRAQGDAHVAGERLAEAQAVVILEPSSLPQTNVEDYEHVASKRTCASAPEPSNEVAEVAEVTEEASEHGVATRTRRRKGAGVGASAAKQ